MSAVCFQSGGRKQPSSAVSCFCIFQWVLLFAYFYEWNFVCLHELKKAVFLWILDMWLTHTHPFNGPLSRTTRVRRYQKGKTNRDFTEARDSEWQWHQLGHIQVCMSLKTDNHASTSPLKFFYRPDALPAAQPTASKHWRQMQWCINSAHFHAVVLLSYQYWLKLLYAIEWEMAV